MTILFDDIIILFLGRILGGLSTTLMFSVFESWMVTEYHLQHLDEAGGSLNDIFGIMTTLNSVVAIVAGLFAQGVSDYTGTQKAPFMTAVICLVLAFLSITKTWVGLIRNRTSFFVAFALTLRQSENYGDSANRDSILSKPAGPEKSGFKIIKDGK
jgi:MFS family permease